MRKTFSLMIILTFITGLQAQVTITSNDMPGIQDTIRISTTSVPTFPDPALTGPDYTWDYSTLIPDGQQVESYVGISATPFLYQIVFNNSVANLASPIASIDFVSGLDVSDAYIFYKNTQSTFQRAGYAATVMGIPIPLKFDNPEIIYKFPLSVNSPADSSQSNFSFSIPNMGYISIQRKRVNQVDGWGSLTTPYGTFEVLRLKSTVYEHDSVFIDSLQTGFPLIRNYVEYQWLGNGQGIPLLTITQEGIITTAQYRDVAANFNPIVLQPEDKTICQGDSVKISVIASGGHPPYQYIWNTMEQTQEIEVAPNDTTTYSVLVTDSQMGAVTGTIQVNVISFNRLDLGADTLLCAGQQLQLNAGNYYDQVNWYVNDHLTSQSQNFSIDTATIHMEMATIIVEYTRSVCSGSDDLLVGFYLCEGLAENNRIRFNIFPNPTRDILTIEGDKFSKDAAISLIDLNGKTIDLNVLSKENSRFQVNTSKLIPGNYFIKIVDGNKTGIATFMRQ
ncbi:MAG: T9SS type A sorting domain-containing protein [Lentimicrobium sp.]|jgi:hypothetical protein|nr:T9SS type A sorting domain-containing protein [Lentimicrobium sp.]